MGSLSGQCSYNVENSCYHDWSGGFEEVSGWPNMQMKLTTGDCGSFERSEKKYDFNEYLDVLKWYLMRFSNTFKVHVKNLNDLKQVLSRK